MTCASAVPKNTWTGAWKPLPKIVTRVPPSIGPEAGLAVVGVGVRTSSWNVNAPVDETRCSEVVPCCVMTVMMNFCGGPEARLIFGVTTWIVLSVNDTTGTSMVGPPVPGSKNTRSGARKFEPVMVMIWPPFGFPMAGVTPVIVGTVATGGVITVLATNSTFVAFVTLFTVAVMVAIVAVLEKIVMLVTPPTVVLMTDWTAVVAP